MDFNNDGHLDLISGSYDPGEVYLFRGIGDNRFSARQTLVDKNGKPILVKPNQQQAFESFGSWIAMVDWDNDGDLDIVLGGFQGEMLLRINEGTKAVPQFTVDNIAILSGGAEIVIPGKAHATPVVADWDADGLWDLLSGSASGAVFWYRNIGELGKPKFGPPEKIVKEHQGIGENELLLSDADTVPGIRSQISVTDFNGDGKLDLLLGDFCSYRVPRHDLTDAEKKELATLVEEESRIGNFRRASMEHLRASFFQKYPGEEVFSDTATKDWDQSYKKFRESDDQVVANARCDEVKAKIAPLLQTNIIEGHEEISMDCGYVWLYLRK